MTIEAPETEVVDSWKVACDGGGAASGPPPRLAADPRMIQGWVECGYCDKKYVHRDFAEKA